MGISVLEFPTKDIHGVIRPFSQGSLRLPHTHQFNDFDKSLLTAPAVFHAFVEVEYKGM